jgi:hypothetical protein
VWNKGQRMIASAVSSKAITITATTSAALKVGHPWMPAQA